MKINSTISIMGLLSLLIIVDQALADQRVTESSLCFDVVNNECVSTLAAKEVNLSQLNNSESPRIYFWSKIQTDENTKVMHVWNKEQEGLDKTTVNLTLSSQLGSLSQEVQDEAKNALYTISQTAHNSGTTQGVILPLKSSPGFRTFSSLWATPGKYSVGVYKLNGERIAGGETQSIELLP